MLAHGTLFNDSVHRSGWWQLAIDTDRGSIDIERPPERQKSSKNDTSHKESLESKQRLKSQPTDEEVWDLRRWYAAGLLEGYMSAPLVAEYAQNAKHSLFGANHYPSEGLLAFLEENRAYVYARMNSPRALGPGEEEAASEEEYWLAAAAILAQFEGLVAGYQATATHAFRAPLSSLELYLLNAYGDIFDLSSLFPPQPGTPPQQLGPWMGGERMRGERRGEHTEKEGTVEGDSGAVWQNRDNDRCSVLMKGVDGNKGPDILVGHTTYDYYVVAWPRMIKETVLPLRGKWTRALYSSSPGQLASLDDLYVLRGEREGSEGEEKGKRKRGKEGGREGRLKYEGKKLIVTETTISMKDAKRDALLPLLKPQSLLYWIRVGIANAQAQTGKEWTEIFLKENSGTYNCEWMVLDASARSFNVLDQAPGKVSITEHSPLLFQPEPSLAPSSISSHSLIERSEKTTEIPGAYFASYNVPSDREIYDYLGFGLKDPSNIKYAVESYTGSPRERMLSEGQLEVTSMAGMKRLIQYNDYMRDSRSLGHAYLAVAGRGDLEISYVNSLKKENEGNFSFAQMNGSPFASLEGAMDAKVVSVNEAFSSPEIHLSLHARVGPTYDQQPAFCWSDHPEEVNAFENGTHPDCFRFEWERLSPGTLLADMLARSQTRAEQRKSRNSLLLRGGGKRFY